MRLRPFSQACIGTLAASILLAALTAASAHAQTYTVLHSFGSGTDGATPNAGVSPYSFHELRNDGYVGATEEGGEFGYGSVFYLKETSGIWTESVVHSFGGSDGLTRSRLRRVARGSTALPSRGVRTPPAPYTMPPT